MNTRVKITFVAILTAIIFCSCFNNKDIDGNWMLTELQNKSTTLTKEDNSLNLALTMTLSKDSSNYSLFGFSGVNNFNGSASVSGSNISISPLASTMAMGTPEDQNIEDSFLQILQAGGKVLLQTQDNQSFLILINTQNDTSLTFVKNTLENTSWNLSMYNIGTAVTNIPTDLTDVSLGFSSDGKVFGRTGVNQITGSYSLSENNSLSFSPLGVTRMAAPNQEIRNFETQLLALLAEVFTYELSGDTLTLRRDTGETLLVYSR